MRRNELLLKVFFGDQALRGAIAAQVVAERERCEEELERFEATVLQMEMEQCAASGDAVLEDGGTVWDGRMQRRRLRGAMRRLRSWRREGSLVNRRSTSCPFSVSPLLGKARTVSNKGNGNRSVVAPFGLHSGLRQSGV